MKRGYFLLIISLFGILSASAQSWIDVTESYVVNPSFVGDDLTTGWQGTPFGSAGPRENAEHFSKNYDSYQIISGLNAGKYRVSVSALYRSGEAGVDYTHQTSGNPSAYQNALLYATSSVESVTEPIALASSAALSQSLGGSVSNVSGSWWDGLFIPNNMEAAYYWFLAGYYHNEVEVNVGDDGKLRIGVRKTTTISADWTCLDNWKLEYYGKLVKATAIEIDPTTLTLGMGEKHTLVANVLPANATYRKVKWTSSNPAIATVNQDGVVTAVGRGTTTIVATSTDGTNVKGQCQVTVEFHGATSENLVINELMPSNIDEFVDPTWNYGGWIELYNPTDQMAHVSHYWLSDDPNNLMQARIPMSVSGIPAHGHLVLWLDHTDTRKDISEGYVNTNIDWKLDCDGGTLYISDDAGNLIAQQTYPAAIHRVSYARTTDGGSEWKWAVDPTPGADNATSTFASEQLPAPVVSANGQIFSGQKTVYCNSVPIGVTCRYTTDGSVPTMTNGETSRDLRFQLTKTTTLRVRYYKDGYLPSDVTTRTYIQQDKDYYLPVISIVTDDKNLYDNEIGIYVSGTNGKTANQDYTKRNFNMEWDRPASIEYIEPTSLENKAGYFAQDVDICISGGWSRKYEPRSFKIKATKKYGLNNLNHTFFPNKPYNRNKALLLRNGGNDEYNQTRLKDAALQEIARLSEFPLNLQSYQPVHVFLNGKYLAMLNLREPSNKHFGYANYGIDTDEIDAFEMSVDSGYVQKDGTKEAFNEWYTLSANAADELTYQQICDRVDMDDYLNYMAFKFFLNDWDWPHNNAKGFRSRNDGKFHFMVFDLDNCVDRTGNNIFQDFQNKRTNTFYGRPEYGGSSITAEVELVTIFLNMLQNADFRRRFIDTYCIVGGSVFGDASEIARIVNGMAENIQPALGWENHNPYGSGRSMAGGIISALTGDFKRRMTDVMRNYSTFGLQSTEPQAVRLSANVPGAMLTINGIEVPRAQFDGYLFAPVTLTAKAPAGYRFAGWSGASEGSTETTSIFASGSNWRYYHTGSLDGEEWMSLDYKATSGWYTGRSPLGYGNPGRPMASAATTLNKEYDGERVPTVYVRKTFTLTDEPKQGETYTLDYSIDDGAIIYVNGEQVDVYHMWSGATYDETCQSRGDNWYEGDDPYNGRCIIPTSLLKKGTNVIAAEVHNCNATSSDLWWDASLSVSRPKDSGNDIQSEGNLELPTSGDLVLEALFEPLSAEEMQQQGITPIRINEVSAGNAVDVNDYYKKDDWVELYNTTDQDIDLDGMYMTDKKSVPHKYQITKTKTNNTIIPAHGYKIVWCSKREEIGSELHANFKLDNEDGKMVRIEAADGSWADSLIYCAHLGDQSVGRYPDGANEVYLMSSTTIRKANRLDSYALEWVAPVDTTVVDGLQTTASTASALTLHYAAGELTVAGQAHTVNLYLYTPNGALVDRRTLVLQGEAHVGVAHLQSGVYVARVVDSEGREKTTKFSITK